MIIVSKRSQEHKHLQNNIEINKFEISYVWCHKNFEISIQFLVGPEKNFQKKLFFRSVIAAKPQKIFFIALVGRSQQIFLENPMTTAKKFFFDPLNSTLVLNSTPVLSHQYPGVLMESITALFSLSNRAKLTIHKQQATIRVTICINACRWVFLSIVSSEYSIGFNFVLLKML